MSAKETCRRATALEKDVAHFLETGEAELAGAAYPGTTVMECACGHDRHLRASLLKEVRRRARGRAQKQAPAGFSPGEWTRRKAAPMIAGLFPASERQVLLDTAQRSIVFLTREAACRAICETGFLHSAWAIANIYLHSLRAPVLGRDGMLAVGMNLETTCYVSMDYFAETDPLADYVVHEIAHIFHNCKRQTLGLPHTRSKEWLLDIAYAKRETFAYACEIYSRLVERARGKVERLALLEQWARGARLCDERVSQSELLDILAGALEARNGWKRILARCRNEGVGRRCRES